MVIFEQILRDLVIQTNVCEQRVFLLRAPQVPAEQMKTPYVVMIPTGVAPLHEMAGPLTLCDSDYQLSVFDTSQTRALAIAATLRGYLDGFRSWNFEGVIFHAVLFRAQSQLYEDSTKLFHVMPEFRFLYRMTADAQPRPLREPTRSTTRSTTR